MSDPSLDALLSRLAEDVRNNTVDTAAKVARLYGASEEICQHILLLRGPITAPARKDLM